MTEITRKFEAGTRIYHPPSECFGTVQQLQVQGTEEQLVWLIIDLDDGTLVRLNPSEVWIAGDEVRMTFIRLVVDNTKEVPDG
jgi:hypothetical protein